MREHICLFTQKHPAQGLISDSQTLQKASEVFVCLTEQNKEKKFLPSVFYPHSDVPELTMTGGVPPEVPTPQTDQNLRSETLLLLKVCCGNLVKTLSSRLNKQINKLPFPVLEPQAHKYLPFPEFPDPTAWILGSATARPA